MKTRGLLLPPLLLLLSLAVQAYTPAAFLYQGRLTKGGAAPTGTFDFQFALYDALTEGGQLGDTVTVDGVAVANGLFAVPLDFGSAPFTGADIWLEIAVRETGKESYAPLAPRQPLAPTPYALFAHAVNWDDILNRPSAFGVYTAGTGLTLAGNEFGVNFGVTASTAARGDHTHDASYWKQGGNAFGAVGSLGTTDNYALELKACNQRALRIEPNDTCPNIILGNPNNSVAATSFAATIGGGGHTYAPNQVSGSYSTIGGGYGNQVTVWHGVVAGGNNNIVNAGSGAIGGGRDNLVDAAATYGAVAGGYDNTVSGGYGAVPGGFRCVAGTASLAAGYRAKATTSGTFLWADYQEADITAPVNNQFIVRAQSGLWFGTGSSPAYVSGRFLNTSTGAYLSSGGAWTDASDRNLKTDFAAFDRGNLLEALATLPITSWRYKTGEGTARHLGPTAQDFRAAFGLGLDDVGIATVDGIGVALAAIQGLQGELRAREAVITRQQQQIDRLHGEVGRLRDRMDAMEALLLKLAPNGTASAPSGVR